MANKELIDSEGNKVTGTFTIDTELSTQDNLITQIQTALEGKASATPTLQEKTATPTTSSQTITPDSNYDGLSKVTVSAMPTATQATPSVSIDSAGKITATATQTAGYVSAGTKTGTKQMTTQAAKTITPSTSSQTAVAKNVYTTGAVTVAAIPSTYVEPTATKAATTYTPTTSNQTIAAGTYCSGAQTIKGDANLKAENIAEGVSIFGVTGTHSGGGSGGGDGGSVETCTVTVTEGTSSTDTSGLVRSLLYTTYENGSVTTISNTPTISGPVILEKVIKGSPVMYTAVCQNMVNANEISWDAYSSTRAYQINGDAILQHWTCFVKDTEILLHNNSTKKVQDITYNDSLLVWDFDNGCHSSANPIWIKKTQTTDYYYRCEFENGIVLNLVGSNGKCHRVFSVDDNRFESATDCVGKTIMTECGASRLLSCERVEENVEYYNIITNYHLNLFANSVLTSCRLNNIYPIKNMKFVKDNRTKKLHDDYPNIGSDMFDGLRIAEQPMTKEEINIYVERLYDLMDYQPHCLVTTDMEEV